VRASRGIAHVRRMTKSSRLIALHAIASALPKDGSAPEWLVVFPALGKIDTRDGRTFDVDGETLLAAFRQDGIDLPLDVMHQTDTALASGGRADAVGWIDELRIRAGALEAHVVWNDEGKALLAAKKYRFTSPSFFHDSAKRVTRLKAIALVTSPALANQPALAASHQQSEPPMKTIATALGLSEDANETSCLSALQARLANSIPKDVHEATLATLAAARGELDGIKTAARKEKVDVLIEGALKAKKILPAEKDHYAALCASDAGFDTVAKLLGGKTELLAASGLDARRAPEGDTGMSAVQLAAEANKLVASGAAVCIADAMTMVTSRKAA
jgi:phage I-like protein